MTIAFDASSEATAGTSDPLEWQHTPVGTPKGVFVGIVRTAGSAQDIVSGVTYGGQAMTRVPNSTADDKADDTANETGSSWIYFLGTSIPTGEQTVSVDFTEATSTRWAACVTVTADESETELVGDEYTPIEVNTENPTITITGIPGASYGAGVMFSGNGSLGTVSGGSGMTKRQDHDFGNQAAFMCSSTSEQASGDLAIGFTSVSDDVAMCVAAIAEVVTGQTENYGVAIETDAALAFAHTKLASYGIAVETDAGLAFIADRRHLYGIASETDAALAFAHTKLASYGLSAETDAALALAVAKLETYGIAGETDAALAFATELGGGDQTAQYGIAIETDAGLAIVVRKLAGYGIASETDSGLAFVHSKLAPYGVATETDAALALLHEKLAQYGIAGETDSALVFTGTVVGAGLLAEYGVAVETDEALAFLTERLAEYGIALEVDRARRLEATKQFLVATYGAALERDSAMPIDSETARILEAFEVARGDFGLGKNRRRKQFTRGRGAVRR